MRLLIEAPQTTHPDDDPLAPSRGLVNAAILTVLFYACLFAGALLLLSVLR
jgi:hypothetical protein